MPKRNSKEKSDPNARKSEERLFAPPPSKTRKPGDEIESAAGALLALSASSSQSNAGPSAVSQSLTESHIIEATFRQRLPMYLISMMFQFVPDYIVNLVQLNLTNIAFKKCLSPAREALCLNPSVVMHSLEEKIKKTSASVDSVIEDLLPFIFIYLLKLMFPREHFFFQNLSQKHKTLLGEHVSYFFVGSLLEESGSCFLSQQYLGISSQFVQEKSQPMHSIQTILLSYRSLKQVLLTKFEASRPYTNDHIPMVSGSLFTDGSSHLALPGKILKISSKAELLLCHTCPEFRTMFLFVYQLMPYLFRLECNCKLSTEKGYFKMALFYFNSRNTRAPSQCQSSDVSNVFKEFSFALNKPSDQTQPSSSLSHQ